MLIRSQDKKNIIVLNNIKSIYLRDCSTDIRTYYGNGYSEIIGTYSTEEKAIKVLDMIENEYLNYHSVINPELCFAFNQPKVFQMPQDDEVKA